MTSADETFEIVASGSALVLLAGGNALVYARPGIVCLPVHGLTPARLAIAWRRDDRRLAVAAFVQACLDTVHERDGGAGDEDNVDGTVNLQRGAAAGWLGPRRAGRDRRVTARRRTS